MEFIREVAEKAGLSQKDTREVLEIIGNVIVAHMKDEDGVTPFAGMKFSCVHKDERAGRNPRTGEALVIPSRFQPRVKFGVAVKNVVND